jgi:hypothetical protein
LIFPPDEAGVRESKWTGTLMKINAAFETSRYIDSALMTTEFDR